LSFFIVVKMLLPFTKMHGNGNDFVVINEIDIDYHLTPENYQMLCDRHYGVGADQVLLIRRSRGDLQADFDYLIINADGTEAGNCGNGARCVAQYIQDYGLSRSKILKLKLRDRIILAECISSTEVSVNMGNPGFTADLIPIDEQYGEKQGNQVWRLTLHSLINKHPKNLYFDVSKLDFCVLSMGNPHAVICVEDLANYPVHEVGSSLQEHPFFPNKVNVGFMQIISGDKIFLRVFERGVGETLCCGSGACAAVVAGNILNLLNKTVEVIPLKAIHGYLKVSFLADQVYLNGPATQVFQGQFSL
ncbi:MAG: diaminopimelate epimerase, partial [Gammaproteobacteria bacterium]|nr:diaminopimelate epimerase [Gammaproteobacteria bacterium]